VRHKAKRRLVPNVYGEFAASYLQAHQRAYGWADKAMAYHYAGNIAKAKTAAQKTLYWLRRIMLLEARRPRPTSEGKS
jgi:hypothetical protein